MKTLPTVTAFLAATIDGFIARTNHALDFLPPPVEGEDYGYAALLAATDALLLGRRTYETVLGFAEWPFAGRPVVVLSSRPIPRPAAPEAAVEQLAGSPAEILAALAPRGWRHLYLDGGETISRFAAAGLLDRLILTRLPILIGAGIPLFGALPGDIPLTHVATRAYPSGLVQTEYRLRPPR